MFHMICIEKGKKNTLPGGLKRVPREKKQRRFPEGVQLKGDPTITTSTLPARRKGDPQHYVQGIILY